MCRVGPLPLAAWGLSKTAGLPSPNVPGAFLIVSDSDHTGFSRPGEVRRGAALALSALAFPVLSEKRLLR
jgi:hypothetical protein